MNRAPVGMKFQETMSGGFALGASDPSQGHEQGKREGCTMTMYGRIAIADLDEFLADPEHPAALSATLDFTPFDRTVEAPMGAFHLFTPGDAPGTKLMLYQLHFSLREQSYFLEGKKFLRDGSSAPELWRASTTLHATLYEGTSSQDAIAGAGILTIGVPRIADLVASMRVTGTRSPLRKAKELARFGEFFFGELWGSYRSHLGLGHQPR